MSFLSVLGHTNIDVQIRLDQLPSKGASTPVKDRRTVYGGTACNIARHAAGLGVPTSLWSRVGEDMPADWRAGLETDGVDLSLMETDAASRTPTCFIFTDADGDQSYAMDQGAMTPPYSPPTAAGICDWLHISTGDPGSYAAAAEEAVGKVALDPGQEIHFAYDSTSLYDMLERADLFWCNEAELAKAHELMRYGDPVQYLDHVDAVIVTRGGDGADLYRAGGKPLHVDAVSIPGGKLVDPTGAGDAFRAGFYAALHAGHDMEVGLRWGAAAGAFACSFEGPQSRTASKDTILGLLPS